MSDPKNGLPAADWYTDPSDPTSERWWGGLEWTNHTRPLDVAPPAAARAPLAVEAAAPLPTSAFAAQLVAAAPSMFPVQPVAASSMFSTEPVSASSMSPTEPVSASSMFPSEPVSASAMFAAQLSAPAQPFSPSQFSSAEEASEVASWLGGLNASTGSPWETTRTAPAPSFFSIPEAPGAPGVQPEGTVVPSVRSRSGRSETRASKPERTRSGKARSGNSQPEAIAPAALPKPERPGKAARPSRPAKAKSDTNVPAIVGFILSLLGFGLISLIISARGAKNASRRYHVGEAPTGRLLARWGIALSIIEIVAGLAVGGLLAYLHFFGGGLAALEQFGAGAGGTTSQNTTLAAETVVDVAPAGETIAAGMAESVQFFYGVTAQSVACPPDAASAPGSIVSCDIVLADGRALTGVQTFTDHGFSTEYLAR